MTGSNFIFFPEDQIYNCIFDGTINRKLPEKKRKENLKPSVFIVSVLFFPSISWCSQTGYCGYESKFVFKILLYFGYLMGTCCRILAIKK
jgi:hypothetical protein